MRITNVTEVRVDGHRRICVTPQGRDFAQIYRAAAEVEWDAKQRFLHSPAPREWTHARWYQQIAEAVRDEYGEVLAITPETVWISVDAETRAAIESLKLGPRTGTA